MLVLDRRQLLTGLAAGILATPALAVTMAEQIAGLKPGQFLWAPQVAPAGPIILVVSLRRQLAFVYRNGVLIAASTISSGKAGHETPTGVFTILQKHVDHKSNLYNAAPMPYMQRLTWDGIALHAGNLPGYPASHGCVRLPLAFAKLLYGVTRLGLTVIITPEAAVPRVAPTPAMLKPGTTPPTIESDRPVWEESGVAQGPVSIIISGADEQMLVLRNGVTIGISPVRIDGAVTEPAAYAFRDRDAAGFHWLRVALPGAEEGAGAELPTDERARLHIPETFRARVAAILTPGTTVVVTPDSLRAGSTGAKLTVIEGAGN
ncbi:L,D-transpeptidase [Sphingomonas sp. ID0503]|uniref:L,D-transpeptidase n=1 Tax=Sphingomonas sp. ID0503 TaxID=3399691 RepID=UPI003AFAC1A6